MLIFSDLKNELSDISVVVTTRKKILHEVAVDRMSESLKEYNGKKTNYKMF